MISPVRTRHPLRLLTIVLILDALLLVSVKLKGQWLGDVGGGTTVAEMVVWGLRGLFFFSFLALAWREVALLFIRPAKNMGPGLSRVWAVARVTMMESWTARVWLLLPLKLGAGLLLILAVRPFDESERIPLYIKMLLSTQEVLLLVMMWALACVSLPRERERKILVTNASKPLSRLEIILGKITGFGAVAALLLLAMGLTSLVVLHVSDLNLRRRALQSLDLQKRDLNQNLTTPSEGLKQLAEQGSLYAYNYITVPKDNLNVGFQSLQKDESGNVTSMRGLIGGTMEKAIYKFGPRLEIPEFMATQASTGMRPYFIFYYPPRPANPNLPPPARVQIRVTAYATGPVAAQEKVLTLDNQGFAAWEPERPDELFTTFNTNLELIRDRGIVTVEVTCPTAGVLLPVLDGADPDAKGELPAGTEANTVFIVPMQRYVQGAQPTTSFPLARPMVRGFERRDRQSIDGPKEGLPHERAVYRFPAASVRQIPVDDEGNFKLSVLLDTYKSDFPQQPTFADITVQSMDPTEAKPFHIRQQVDEKRLTTLTVPGANLGDKDPTRRGDLVVLIFCDTVGHSVTLVEDSVRIELAPTRFFVNLFKSEAVIFLEALLLITISVTCSVRLGWPVAMTLSGLAFLFGHFRDWIASLQEYGGLGALNYHLSGQDATWLYNFLDASASGLWTALGFISIVVPNFNLFQPQQYIGNLQNMPWSVLAGNAVDTLIYTVPFLALAQLLFRKQEVG